ncbi:MAG TPA: hypothetical protein VF658_06485 [Pyrinomonadaceae bacterium]|jgi:hypothetical protein
MNNRVAHSVRICAASLGLMLTLAIVAFSQQQADQTFDAKVSRPAYTSTHPKVLFDEAHNNFHTMSGRYKPFADLITNDGCQVVPNKEKFERRTLEGYDVLEFGTPQEARTIPAAGRAQAVVMPFGKGRVAVFGEAAMRSAQNRNFGMNYQGTDNRQLVLNVMHWLTGLLR